MSELRWVKNFGIALALFISIFLVTSIKVTGMGVDDHPSYVVGDFFEYEFDYSQVLDDTIQDDEDLDSYNIIINDFKISIIGSEALEIQGEMVDCFIGQAKLDFKYEIIGSGDIKKMTSHMIITSKSWFSKENDITCQGESITTLSTMIEYSDSYYRESFNDEVEISEKTTYSELPEPAPYPFKVGKTWSLKESFIMNTTTKFRERYDDDPYSDWEFEYEEISESTTTNFEVLSENENVVPAGTFNTMKIKSQVVGESDYDVDYLDSNGNLIQSESYVVNIIF